MDFNKHFELNGRHSFLSGSSYHWINYTPEKLAQVFMNQRKKEEGTELHEIASNLIVKRLKLAPLKKALNMFVNDAIGFGMVSEQVLYYSDNCFGTADAILFKNNFLQIHDLKTGIGKVSFKQLDIYTAMFCLEYNHSPHDIAIEHRIYQGREYMVQVPDPDDIKFIMDKIIDSDKIIDQLKYEL